MQAVKVAACTVQGIEEWQPRGSKDVQDALECSAAVPATGEGHPAAEIVQNVG